MSAPTKHRSFEEAIERIKDVNSCLQLIHVSEHVALSPKHTANSVDLNCAIKTTLDAKLHKYSPKYGGLPVAYNNVTLLDTVGRTFSVSPMVYLNVMLDLIIFHPQVGSYVSGIVNKISFRHLGVLVHGIFNAAIEVPHKGRKNTFHEGQEIVFEVTEINTIHGLPIIKGKLSKEVSRDFNADENVSKKLSSYRAPDSKVPVTELSNQHNEKNSESPIVHSNSQNTEQYLGNYDIKEPNCLSEISENNYDLAVAPNSEKRKKKKKQDMSPVKGHGIDDITSDDIDGNSGKCITSEKRNKHLVKGESNLSALPSSKTQQYEETEGDADVSYKDSSFQRKKKKKHHHSHEEIDASAPVSIAPFCEDDFEKSVESHKKKNKHLVKTEPLEIEDPSLLNALPPTSESHKKKKKKHSRPDAVNSPSLLEITSHKDDLSDMPETESFVTGTSFNCKKKKKRQKFDNQCDFVKETKVDVGETDYKIAQHKKRNNELFVKSEVTEESFDCTIKKAKKHRRAESN